MSKIKLFALLAFVIICLITACGPNPDVSPLVGPDGEPVPAAPEGAGFEWSFAHIALVAAIFVFAPVAAAEVILKLREAAMYVEDKFGGYDMYQLAKDAVKAAEAMGARQLLADFGNEKLTYALDFLQQQFDARGIPLRVSDYASMIRGYIEQAVSELYPHS